MPLLRRESWTRIWVIPLGNLLGVSLFVLMCLPPILVAVIVGYGVHPSPGWRPLGLLFPLTLIVAATVDCRWRLRQPPMASLKRWLSPYEGATLVVFPIWLCSAALLLAPLGRLIRHSR